jgi:hypothetical protein
MERGITPYMRTRDNALRKNNPLYGPERFTFLPESNSYLCPAGQPLNFVGLNVRNRTHAYIGSRLEPLAVERAFHLGSDRFLIR